MYKYLIFINLCLINICFGQKKAMIYKTAEVITTAQNTDLKLSPNGRYNFEPLNQPLETQTCIFLNAKAKFQSYEGIGGAITDASAETFYKLPKEKQEALLNAYYDPKNGIGYTIARTNINSCDFSSDMYTYVEDNDKSLISFDIKHDKQYKIPFIKEALKTSNGKLKLFVSPWSPPAWMKDNNDMLHGGKLLKEHYPTWATYFTKFIKEYEKNGLPIWGLTIQNEPLAKQKWESCIYSADEEMDFLKNHLGPQMIAAGYKDKKIIVWDHNRDFIYQRASTYFNDPIASKYIWGIGFHWYEDWSGGQPMYDNIKSVHEAYPDKHIFFTEGCAESFNPEKYNNWGLGEEYAKSMIHDFNNGMEGFTDWNVLLDQFGGPNHVQNFCFAPVHADVAKGELIFTNAYYYIGHFSKFIQQGAKRIGCTSSRSQILSTAFQNTDGKIVVIALNTSNEKASTYIWMDGNAVKVDLLPHSISTIKI